MVPAVVPWQERSPAGQPMALDTPAGEELTPADFFEVRTRMLNPYSKPFEHAPPGRS